MRLRYKLALFVAGVLGCTFLLQRCNKPTTVKGPAQITYQGGGDLIEIDHKAPNGKITHEEIYQPDPKSTIITTDSKGNVTVKVRQFGVGFDPGIGISYSDRLRVDFDARVAYFKRFGLNAGMAFIGGSGVSLRDIVKPYCAISYTPFNRFANTSIFIGLQIDKKAIGGLRVKF